MGDKAWDRMIAEVKAVSEWDRRREHPEPCPFCAGQAAVFEEHYSYVRCMECGAWTRTFVRRSDAIAAWNRRAT